MFVELAAAVTRPCPLCGAEMTRDGEARLEETASTFLPAERFACPNCPTVVIAATSEGYRSYPRELVGEREIR
jgi:predicted RNA-binding Zn-ribbon protein involved in translation (DUF1610 family)